MRIPVGDEGLKVAEAVHVPEGYMLPCYIGLGYPVENAAVVEQVERSVKIHCILANGKTEVEK